MPEIGTQTVIEQPVKVAETAKETAKVVSKREVDKSAEKIKAERALPPIPGKNVDYDSLVSWLGLLNEIMWKHVMIYVYRHDPVIDFRLVNPDADKYIDVIGSTFDRQYMIERHGGGKYGFYITDTDLSKGAGLFESHLNIPVTQHDPKIDVRTLDVNHKDNKKWLLFYQQRGELDKNNRPIDKATPVKPAGENIGEVVANAMLAGMDRATQMMNRNQPRNNEENGGLGKAIGDILVEKMRQDDPAKSFAAIGQIAQIFKKDDNSEVFKMMLEIQKENSRQMIELLKAQNQSQKEKEPKEEKSAIEQLKEVLELQDLLGLKRGGSSHKSGWDIGMDIVDRLGVPVISLVNTILNGAMIKKPQPNQVMQPPIMNPTVAAALPTSNLVEMPNPVAQGYGSMGKNPNPETGEQPQQTVEVNPDLVATFNQFGGIVQKNINDGVKGYTFAENLVSMFGADKHQMVAKYGVEGVINGMKAIPEFWHPLVSVWGEEYLFNWVGEFINYEAVIANLESQEDEDDDNNEPEAS